jgi:class 3 adenylate cyclase
MPLRGGALPRNAPMMTARTALQRRVQQFRYGAYSWLAIELAVLALHAVPAWPAWAGVVGAPLWVFLLCAAERRLRRSLLELERLVVPFAVGVLALPLLPAVVTVGALLTGSVAQLGWRALPEMLLGVAAGASAGRLFAFDIGYGDTALADALCVAFIVLYTVPLCALGYEQTMRMHRAGERVRVATQALLNQRDRLARYVAPPVAVRLAAAPVSAPLQRRWLTIAFVDVIDFTALTERLPPEDLVGLLEQFFGGIDELAEQHGGNLHKFLGDGALISFGEVDGCGRVADASSCIAMLRGVAALLETLNDGARRLGIAATLAVRAGVASGYCTVGDFGRGRRLEYTMLGAAVNLASRLQALAAPGETWVAQGTRDLVEGEAFDTLGEIDVKGFAAPLRAYRLRAAHPVDAPRGAL